MSTYTNNRSRPMSKTSSYRYSANGRNVPNSSKKQDEDVYRPSSLPSSSVSMNSPSVSVSRDMTIGTVSKSKESKNTGKPE